MQSQVRAHQVVQSLQQGAWYLVVGLDSLLGVLQRWVDSCSLDILLQVDLQVLQVGSCYSAWEGSPGILEDNLNSPL